MAVFVQDLDRYFLTTIQQNIKVTDENGNLVPIKCLYHMAEGEGEEEFNEARITFFLYDILLDPERNQSDHNIIISEDENTVTVKPFPIPYRLYYQFDIWSPWAEDIAFILPQFQKLFPPRCSILVPNENGEIYELYMELTYFKNADARLWDTGEKMSNDRRFFRKILRYMVVTELDISDPITYSKVKYINVNSQPKESG